MKQKILVTGSSGMLGSDLVAVLSSGFEVFGITRNAAVRESEHQYIFDLTHTALLRDTVRKLRPDYVIHAAAFTKVDLCEDPSWQDVAVRQNVGVVRDLIPVCNETGARLIFFSTDYVFNGIKKEPYIETDPIDPINFYGRTKELAEDALRKHSDRFLIFRVTWLYGKNGQHFPKAILSQATKKEELSIVNDQWGRPTWTRDIALALRELLTSRQNLVDQYNKQTFHIGNCGQTNWSAYARYLLDLSGFERVRVREISSSELNRPAKRPENSVLALDAAAEKLGIQMRPWQEALSEFIKKV